MTKEKGLSKLAGKLKYETKGEIKNLEITDEQYMRLITLLKVAIIVVGSNKKKFNIPYLDVFQFISSFSKRFNGESLLVYSEEAKLYYGSDACNLVASMVIDIFSDDFIYEQLSQKLAWRDGLEKYKNKSVGTAKVAIDKLSQMYFDEFNTNGIKNLKLIGAPKNKLKKSKKEKKPAAGKPRLDRLKGERKVVLAKPKRHIK